MSDGLIVASNRGPVSWVRGDDGGLRAQRGAGGLVSALGGALQRERGTWVSVALSAGDQEMAGRHDGEEFGVDLDDGGEIHVRLVDAGEAYDRYYNDVANRLLWFTLHQLWAEPYQPTGEGWQDAWADYQAVNAAVAGAVAAAADGKDYAVHLQDYHLCAAAPTVREALPDTPILHYLHTPWMPARYLRRLPAPIVRGVLDGLLACDVVGLSSPEWADAFRDCAVQLAGARADGSGAVIRDGHRTVVHDFVLGVDEGGLRAVADSAAAERERSWLAELVGDRMLLGRADRSDLSKNILRGLRAYRRLLEEHEDLRDRVVKVALINPSRQDVPEYRDYLERCQAEADAIRDAWGEDVLAFEVGQNFPRVIALLQRYDVLLTNPVVDGTNLVAKEGPALNERDGVLVLSPSAGAANVLGDAALLVNPYDVEDTADALHRALTMDRDSRAERAARLTRAAHRGAPGEWLAAQRAALRDACG